MNALRDQITPEVIAQMSSDEKRELILLLEALSTPKLARVKPDPPRLPGQPSAIDLGERLDAARKRPAAGGDVSYTESLREILTKAREHDESLTDEQRAAEEKQRERDEEELLVWADGPGKNVEKAVFVNARIRVARHNREVRDGTASHLQPSAPRVSLSPVEARHPAEARTGLEFAQRLEADAERATELPFTIAPPGRPRPAAPVARNDRGDSFPMVSELVSLFKN